MATITDALHYYRQFGWTVIPLPLKEKGPLFDNWQTVKYQSEDDLVALFKKHWGRKGEGNIGVLLGSPSGNLVDIDLDWPEAVQLAPAFLLPTGTVFGRASKQNSHFLYKSKIDNTRKFQITGEQGGTVAEVRSTGGQTVLPLSQHPSGELIVFAADEDPSPVGPDRLLRAVSILAAGALLLRAWTPGIKDDLAAAVVGVLLRGEWEPDRIDKFIEIISMAAGDRNTREKLKAERMQRALQTRQGHVPGLPRLRELIGEGMAERFVEWLGIKGTNIDPFPLEALLTLSQFNATTFPPLDYVIDGLLYSPSISMIYAPRGQGKTWLAQSMAIALASGQSFLFWNVMKSQRCLYVDGEMPSAMLQDRFRLLTQNMDLPVTIFGNEVLYRTAGETFCISNTQHQQRFIATLEALEDQGRGCDFIFFDNLSALTFGIDENSNFEQDTMVMFFRDLRLMGKSVVFLHHAGKSGDQRGASRREDILDLVIKLGAPELRSSGGCEFRFEITKARGMEPRPSVGEAALIQSEEGKLLVWSLVDQSKKVPLPKWAETMRLKYNTPLLSVTKLAEIQGCSRQNIERNLKKAAEAGYMLEGIITDLGLEYLRKFYNTTAAEDQDNDVEEF